MDVNLWGTLQMTQAAVPAMIERGGGSIVMINSMSTHRIEPSYGAYARRRARWRRPPRPRLETAPTQSGSTACSRLHQGRSVEWYLRLPREEARHHGRGGVTRRVASETSPEGPAALQRDRRARCSSSRRTCRSRSPGRALT
jgi:hypothetical protein